MTASPNAPHFVLAAVKRIYPELPDLTGEAAWPQIQPQVDDYLAALEAQPNDYLAATQLFGLLAQYEPARQRLAAEITVQEVVDANIAARLDDIARSLGFEGVDIGGLSAAAFARLAWQVDPATIPPPDEDARTRGITLSEGGLEGGQSVKFKNLRLDLSEFSQIAAGFVTTGFDVIDRPHPLLIAAGLLLTVSALHSAMKIELSEQEASVFWGMIRATEAGEAKLSEAVILATTNAERETYGLAALSDTQVRHSLQKLLRMKSIAATEDSYTIIERYQIED